MISNKLHTKWFLSLCTLASLVSMGFLTGFNLQTVSAQNTCSAQSILGYGMESCSLGLSGNTVPSPQVPNPQPTCTPNAYNTTYSFPATFSQSLIAPQSAGSSYYTTSGDIEYYAHNPFTYYGSYSPALTQKELATNYYYVVVPVHVTPTYEQTGTQKVKIYGEWVKVGNRDVWVTYSPPKTKVEPVYTLTCSANVSGTPYLTSQQIVPACSQNDIGACGSGYNDNQILREVQHWTMNPVTSTPPANHLIVYIPTNFKTGVNVVSLTGDCPTGWMHQGSQVFWQCNYKQTVTISTGHTLTVYIVVTVSYAGTNWNFGDGQATSTSSTTATYNYQYITTSKPYAITAQGVANITATASYVGNSGLVTIQLLNQNIYIAPNGAEKTYVMQAEGV